MVVSMIAYYSNGPSLNRYVVFLQYLLFDKNESKRERVGVAPYWKNGNNNLTLLNF